MLLTNIIRKINKFYLKNSVLKLKKLQGSVLVLQYLTFKSLTRVQQFTGICIKVKKRNLNTYITLRNVVNNFGTELTMFLHSPLLRNYYIVEKKHKRSSKLYFLRNKPLKFSFVKYKIIKK